MNTGLSNTNPVLVAAFRSALLHQGLVIVLVLLLLGLAWAGVREWVPGARSAARGSWSLAGGAAGASEPAARRLLRVGFGIIWIFDGLLQAQPAMAAGLPSQVIKPTAASSPVWVQHLVNWAGTSWSYHPVQAGAAAVWIQVGIGAWLVAAPSGWFSRLAGLTSVGWGLVVWVFGEAFGGIFAPGLTFLFGAPGAVLFYCAAGLLIALPAARWRSPLLARQVVGLLGVFFLGMAVLQAWPGRGFWQGRLHGQPGSLASMALSMSGTSQPHVLSAMVNWFASADEAHGLIINLIAVIVLTLVGAAFLIGTAFPDGTAFPADAASLITRPRLVRAALILLVLFCLADWVLIEDFGFLGGLGTDPNSMIPVALLAAGGYLAMVTVPADAVVADTVVADTAVTGRVPADSGATVPAAASSATSPRALPAWLAPSRQALTRLAKGFGSASLRAVVALWAVVMVLIGVGPLAAAQASPTANVIIAQAIDGNAAPLDFAAAPFTLTDQHGKQVSLASLRGKVVLLTFLDPVCTSDCPLIAQEFREADQVLGPKAENVALVAVVANPVYHSVADTRAFDKQEGLSAVPNWLYLTGSVPALQQVWKHYGIAAQIVPAGAMILHNDVAFVIDARGHERAELNFDPGPGTASSTSSFAAELAAEARQVMA
ncbi:MAG TPA: SCO family protein [Streptosporangiaceae bacterium]|nr:SCO family protein [Streptosporangiaceae bacterium]